MAASKVKIPKVPKYSRSESNGKVRVKNLKTGKTRVMKKRKKS